MTQTTLGEIRLIVSTRAASRCASVCCARTSHEAASQKEKNSSKEES
jgi:hypothetical protein